MDKTHECKYLLKKASLRKIHNVQLIPSCIKINITETEYR